MCIETTIDADPEYEDVTVKVEATGLESVDARTSVDRPFPGGDRIDEVLWENVPLFGIRYQGGGPMKLFVSGNDDPDVQNYVDQHMTCCIRQAPTAWFNSNIDLDGKPLKLRFYGWIQDGVTKRNRQGEALVANRDAYIHHHIMPWDSEPVPFHPRFIVEDNAWNGLTVLPGETAYFVPNPYDILASEAVDPANADQDKRRKRWYLSAVFPTIHWQSDWLFQLLLHKIEPDPLGFI